MISRLIISTILVFPGIIQVLYAQMHQTDPVLFIIDNKEVHRSEFTYVYEKSNGESADYSKESVTEFLDLYKKFKLKVAEAREEGMADNPQLDIELSQYKNQLADKYMSDHAMLGHLTHELYERMQWDIDVSHILRIVPPNSTAQVEDLALEDLEKAKAAVESGMDFSVVAKQYSQDQSVLENQGHLGYRRAKLPDGFYELETAIYNAREGVVVGPVRSKLGYHLVRVNGRRPYPGTMEIAHILIRTPRPGNVDTTHQHIDRIYQMLRSGAEFDELALKYSEDQNNNRQNGYLGRFSTGTYSPEFESAAFTIQEDGGFSEPVKTAYGWHIIRRLSLDTLDSYSMEKRNLENLIRSDSRYELAQGALIERIKKEENFEKEDVSGRELLEVLTEKVFQLNWQVPEQVENRDLFQIRNIQYDLDGFLQYLKTNIDVRYQSGFVRDPESAALQLLDTYIDHSILDFEKNHLEEKYPEFREIIREYREGIMLFEISKDKIWDRAGQDSTGLRNYYEAHRSNYHTPRNIVYNAFTVRTNNSGTLDKVEKIVRKKKPEKVIKKFNKAANVVSWEQDSEQEDVFKTMLGNEVDNLDLETIYRVVDPDSGTTMMAKIISIGEGQPLSFEESRGSVMSDYQKYLEEQWITELKGKYDIEVNKKVLESIIKS